jgi:DNA polymerase-3 subunit delta'
MPKMGVAGDRPRSQHDRKIMWSKIIGHKRQIEQLRGALASHRLANAYLFSGPAGIGKRLVADAFVAESCCEAPSDDGACGNCKACRKLTAGNHPDIFSVEPELSERGVVQNIKIERIRELQSSLKFSPLEAARKIAIIDGADRLMEAASNSLLKVLEEPPADTHFILITPYPHRLLATIRSRSQMIAFSPLPEGPLAREIAGRHSISNDEAVRIARLSGGSLGTALRLDPEFVREILARFLPLAEHASSADVIEASQAWKELDIDRTPLVFDLMASWYRDLIKFKATGREGDLVHPEAARRAATITTPRILENLASINGARLAAETSANKQLMFEQLLFSLASS